MPKRLSTEDVKNRLTKHGYVLLESYESSAEGFKVRCPAGHEYVLMLSNFTRGTRCKKCMALSYRRPFKDVCELFESEGYTVLSSEDSYVNSKSLVDFRCPNNHGYSISISDFVSGCRCGLCARNKKVCEEEVRSVLEISGYSLESIERIRNSVRVTAICSKGHRTSRPWSAFSSSSLKCAGCEKDSYREWAFRDTRSRAKEIGLTITDSKYKSADSHINFVCSEGHRGTTTRHRVLARKRCGICFKKSSSAENEIANYLFEKLAVEQSNRSIIHPKELDIFFPERKLAVEYCGLFWHSEKAGHKTPEYHYDKLIACEKAGVTLLTVFEDEFLERKQLVLDTISSELGVYRQEVGVENGHALVEQAGTKSPSHTKEFIEKNSLAREISEAWAILTVKVEQRLVAALPLFLGDGGNPYTTGIVARRGSKVAGVEGVLFEEAKKFLRKNGVNRLGLKLDMRWFLGHVDKYKSIGFRFIKETKPTPHFVYLNGESPKRFVVNKENLKVDRIWDCGFRNYELVF